MRQEIEGIYEPERIHLSAVRRRGRVNPVLAAGLAGILAAGIVGLAIWGHQSETSGQPRLSESGLAPESPTPKPIPKPIEDVVFNRLQHKNSQGLRIAPESEQRRIQGADPNISLNHRLHDPQLQPICNT